MLAHTYLATTDKDFMKQTVWKYPLTVADQTILMPPNAQILCVLRQGMGACLWAQVVPGDPVKVPLVPRRFVIVGTGQELPETPSLWYVGTFQWDAFVCHVFERDA